MTAIDARSPRGIDAKAPYRPVTGAHTASAHVATTVTPRLQPALERRRLWERRYRRRLQWTDALIVLASTAAAAAINALSDPAHLANPWLFATVPSVAALAWGALLALFGTRSASIVGSGSTEYKRVAHATGLAFGLVAMLFVVFQLPGVRTQLLVALPLGLFGVLLGRWLWRRWLMRQRAFGHYTSRTLVTGSRDDVEYVIGQLQQDPYRAHTIVGAATADGGGERISVGGHSYPVVGTTHSVAMRARELGADSVVVASRLDDDPDFVRRLGWQLEGTASELILSSRLTDVAGPRISLRPVDGLPLIHVRIPEFEGGRHLLKRAMDIAVATLALIPITLVGLPIALLIALGDGGPVFFRQTRIGRDGEEFKMVKFRTMRVTAEAELAALKAANEGAGPLFKLKRDPRITRIGGILRTFSLDELPQFWNVLRGDMSVVGPRPPLPDEVTRYDGTVYRRLYIKPGITGLWQISGRSDLSWEESVRLDLRYVENWSVMNDLMIMWRTAKVMLRPEGAY